MLPKNNKHSIRMTSINRKKVPLWVLSALMMFGMNVSVNAAISLDKKTVGFQTSSYDESSISNSNASTNSVLERYSNTSNQVYFAIPLNKKLAVEANFINENVSGAYPVYIEPANASLNSEGKPIDPEPKVVMSSVAIEDTRKEVSVKTSYFRSSGVLEGTLGVSNEDDYRSVFAALAGSMDINEKHNTVDYGFGLTSDDITPIADNVPPSSPITSQKRESLSVFAGISQIIDRNSTINTELSITRQSGYLSDPYQLVGRYRVGEFVQVPDSRPEERTQVAWTIRYRLFMPKRSGALHVDYRYYTDNWDVVSHALDVSWHHSLPANWQLIPGLRYYSQSEAEFYDPYFLVDPVEGFFFSSSDFRLSPYGVFSFRLKVIKDIESWRMTLLMENYNSDGDLGLGTVKTVNPALVDFTYLTLGLDYKF